MPDLPHITLLMATYNGATHLADQLASFAAQDHKKWSLWVSDDGSTDGTQAMIRAFAKDHPDHDVRLTQGPQGGPAANFLSLLCHPDLPSGPVALSDQDDIWRPDKLRLALTALHGHTGPAVYSAQSRHITQDGAPIGHSRPHKGTPSFGNALVQNRIAGHCATLNAAALALVRQAGPVDVPFHDWWLYLLLSGAEAQILISHDTVLDYRQHDRNVLGGNRRRFASVSRITAVLGRTFRSWQNRNLAALDTAAHLLTPRTREVLAAWRHAPPAGPARVRAARSLGITRDSRPANWLLACASLLGRV